MEILEAFDLVGTLRGAAVLAECDHKTVATVVRLRDEAAGRRAWGRVSGHGRLWNPFAGKIAEWVGALAREDPRRPGRMSGWC